MIDLNAAAAAVRCGYSPKTSRAIACELLTKPYIQAELEARGAALARKLEITRADVVRGFLDAFEMARADRKPGGMVSSMAAVAKFLNMYAVETKRVELGAGQVPLHRFEQMTDAELINILAVGVG